MLGQLDGSHIVRCIDYRLHEKSRPEVKDWETVTVLAAEDVRGSRYFKVAQYLAEVMPLIVIEMKAHKIGDKLALIPTALLDGTASVDNASVEIEPKEAMGEKGWTEKSSPSSAKVVADCGKILKRVSPEIALNWSNRNFIGLTVRNRPRNFLVFKPKRNFVRVHARFLTETEEWSKKLTKAHLPIVGGKPKWSLHFRQQKASSRRTASYCKVSLRKATKTAPARRAMNRNKMITIFSWGYWGWGSTTRQLVQAVDATEAARGYGPLYSSTSVSAGQCEQQAFPVMRSQSFSVRSAIFGRRGSGMRR